MEGKITMERDEAVKCLRKNSVNVDTEDKIITLRSGQKIGNKIWGYIDCLVNYHDFIAVKSS